MVVKKTFEKQELLSFFQTVSNTFWSVENLIAQHEIIGDQLLKAREEMSCIIREVRDNFPETFTASDILDSGKKSEKQNRVKPSLVG